MRYKIRNKKASHVGIVLSFVIFISFVVFIYVVLQPTVVSENKENLVEFVKGKIVNEVSASVKSGSASVSGDPAECVQLNNFFDSVGISGNFAASDTGGNELSAGTTGSGVEHLRIVVNNEKVFRFYESEEFGEISGTSGCDMRDYEIVNLKTENYIFESKIIELVSKYEINYSGLAQDLSVPSANGFWFNFTGSDDVSISPEEKDTPSGTSVFSKDLNVIYLSEETTIESGKLTVSVW